MFVVLTRRGRTKKRRARTSPGRKAGKALPQSVGALRTQLVGLLGWSDAHLSFDDVLREWPERLRGVKPAGAAPRGRGVAHTAWQLVEHMRIAQWDILEFSRNAKHVSPEFPSGYWPATEAPPDASAWEKSLEAFRADLRAMKQLVEDPKTDLFARIPHGEGQTILREALLVADHNAYHLGQLVLLRRLLGTWSE